MNKSTLKFISWFVRGEVDWIQHKLAYYLLENWLITTIKPKNIYFYNGYMFMKMVGCRRDKTGAEKIYVEFIARVKIQVILKLMLKLNVSQNLKIINIYDKLKDVTIKNEFYDAVTNARLGKSEYTLDRINRKIFYVAIEIEPCTKR